MEDRQGSDVSRETYAERRTRETTRDRILDFAEKVATNVAGGEMLRVERSASAMDWPRFQFSGPILDTAVSADWRWSRSRRSASSGE